MMKALWFYPLCALWIAVCAAPASSQSPAATSDADVPVAPLTPVEFQGWTNAIRMANTNLEIVILPDIGRIAMIRYQNSDNILRFTASPSETSGAEWVNAGGEWLWPVPQSRWHDISGRDWPPPPELADQPWNATAWKAADRSLNCSLTREYPRPLPVKIIRNIRLHPDRPEITIRQRIERKHKSPLRVALWNIFQVADASAIFIPIDSDSEFERGIKPMMFDPPPDDILMKCNNVVVYRPGTGEHKLCSDSKQAWIAALKEGVLLFVHVTNDESDAPFPDGGCRLEMYSNAGLGYSEIETLSPEKTLQDVSALQNTITVRCFPAPASDLCAIAKALSPSDEEILSEEEILVEEDTTLQVP